MGKSRITKGVFVVSNLTMMDLPEGLLLAVGSIDECSAELMFLLSVLGSVVFSWPTYSKELFSKPQHKHICPGYQFG